jgi:hypothetical protein
LHVPLVATNLSEVIDPPMPLVCWLARPVTLELQQGHAGHGREVVHAHFSILLAYIMDNISSTEESLVH